MNLETALQRIKDLEVAIGEYLESGPHLHGDIAVESQVARCPRCQARERLEEVMSSSHSRNAGRVATRQ